VGPGSSADDHAAVGIGFRERWRRFDEAVQVLRALLHGGAGFEGEFYSTRGMQLEPRPVQRPGPPIWVASWGSPAGLRRVARLGDGWLASAYNTTPDSFRDGLDRLGEELRRRWSTLDLGSEERRVGEPGLRFRRTDPAKDVTRASSPSRPTIP
jgi:alkanesulfonate monooxygenase SsuD/methylene tetrahydromethanopterin reductase-like flavin-dependent oxidoreductase (luciferase family)